MDKTRTSWDVNMIVGIPFSRWGAKPFVIHPFPFPVGIVEQMAVSAASHKAPSPAATHSIRLALEWRAKMQNDASLTRAKIAAKEGISRPRVTQIMGLLALPEEIQDHLAKLTDPREIRFLSERRLRQIAPLNSNGTWLQEWAGMLKQFKENFAN